MSRLIGLHMSAYGASDKGKVTQEVEHFVARWLVLPLQGPQLQEAQMRGIAMGSAEGVGQFVEVVLCHRAVIDDESVAQIATTYESHLQKWRYLAHKHEGSGSGEVGGEARKVRQLRPLCGNQFRSFKINGAVDAESCRRSKGDGLRSAELPLVIIATFGVGLRCREDAKPRTCLLIAVLQGFGNGEIVAGSVLFEQSYAEDFLHIIAAAAVEDGKFRTVDLYQTVVDTAGKEGGHGMFDGGNADVAISDDGTSRGIDHTICQRRYDWFAGKVDTLHLKTMAYGGSKEGNCQVESGMQTLAAQREWGKKCMLHVGFLEGFEGIILIFSGQS